MVNLFEKAQLLGLMVVILEMFEDDCMSPSSPFNSSLDSIAEALMSGKKMSEDQAWDLIGRIPSPEETLMKFVEKKRVEITESIRVSLPK